VAALEADGAGALSSPARGRVAACGSPRAHRLLSAGTRRPASALPLDPRPRAAQRLARRAASHARASCRSKMVEAYEKLYSSVLPFLSGKVEG